LTWVSDFGGVPGKGKDPLRGKGRRKHLQGRGKKPVIEKRKKFVQRKVWGRRGKGKYKEHISREGSWEGEGPARP